MKTSNVNIKYEIYLFFFKCFFTLFIFLIFFIPFNFFLIGLENIFNPFIIAFNIVVFVPFVMFIYLAVEDYIYKLRFGDLDENKKC